VFPSHQQSQIRSQLSLVLEGIMCQALLPKRDGKGRALCQEVLIPNPAVRNLIREDKVHQIYSMMQTGQAKYGMQTFNQALATLYFADKISLEMAMSRSSLPEELHEMIQRGAATIQAQAAAGGGGQPAGAGAARPAAGRPPAAGGGGGAH
jgi:twitching motility protein PilT